MNEITNHADLTVEKKVEGAYKRNRMLMKVAYIVAPIVLLILFSVAGMLLLGLIMVLALYPTSPSKMKSLSKSCINLTLLYCFISFFRASLMISSIDRACVSMDFRAFCASERV